MPARRDAAKAISELGEGLDDAEYIGGLLWTGLTSNGAEGTRTSRNASSSTG
jgi:hypothetical protein